ncbi:alpha/beta fold hydrolase [Magnetospira sp. QH-2]|uniref:alpha/beta fold hydrolase n=1 Tax=Magnetospira sp. (strain QH-2) TaxID=1288970 RepID=UPI0003E8130D|nr:alpha/beta fold hydrolase [Magnetospira sp. QH-2]CCQ73244.1 Conserved protein of unknown function. Similar to esterase/lipase-like protein from Desulfococcus oleovorans (strain DSM 6200 / Hxd3) [Magnetospira sp. QH-2]
MADERAFRIKESTYGWCVKLFGALEKRLGLNIKVHPNEDLLSDGQIFLFNHFARFETIIPPYILLRASGTHCRTIADRRLFELNDRFSAFLRGVGAVPNDLPGLLPFLAAEVLRGRKVVVFPEGRMVKDRFIGDDGEGLHHHRGAAVLAMTLDLFKRRILQLHQMGDDRRIAHWVSALGLKDTAELFARALEPTLLVPANITFYPIRVRENFLSRTMERFKGDLPRNLSEELLIEGNLLFKNTDMDIRLAEPMRPRGLRHWWERFLLSRQFEKIASLEDLFGLREQALGPAERLLNRCLDKEMLRLRDGAMTAMYAQTTVNLSHLASCMTLHLLGQGKRHVNRLAFHRALYIALKNLQAARGVSLHRSLHWPDRYRGLPDGKSPELDRFLATCRDAGLIAVTPSSYTFLDKLAREHRFHDVRMENPVAVYANEVAALPMVREAVEDALRTADRVTEADLASLLFDDELRARTWNTRYFHKPRFAEINDKETATASADPYLLTPPGARSTGVLLIHGLSGSPAEMRPLADKLKAAGYPVLGLRLAGHGTSPHDLEGRVWEDWAHSVGRGYRIIAALTDRVVAVGFGTGGLLALTLAGEQHCRLAGVASISAPVVVRQRQFALMPWMHRLNRLASWVPTLDGIKTFTDNETSQPDIDYRSMPVSALRELQGLIDATLARLDYIHIPVTLIQGEDDPVADPTGARRLYERLPGEAKDLYRLSAAIHGIHQPEAEEARERVSQFISWIDSGTPRLKETG